MRAKDDSINKAFEISMEGIYTMDLIKETTVVNDGYYRLIGFEPNEINLDMPMWKSLIHSDDKEWVEKSYDNVEMKEDTFISIEYRLKTKSGEFIWVLDRSKIVKYSNQGIPLKSIGTITIIDQIKKAEQEINAKNEQLEKTLLELKNSQTQLIEMEKMATLGLLTSGIAHELNNPLNYVKGNVHPLKNDFLDISDFVTTIMDSEEFRKSSLLKTLMNKYNLEELFLEINTLLEAIELGAQKSSDLVKTLRIFSDDQNSLKPKLLNLHDNIESALKLLQNRIPESINIHKKFGDIPAINGWPGKLNQVFTNLLCNSIEALEQHKQGNIYISTFQENGNIHVRFEDDGPGIEQSDSAKIFEPFFSHKNGYNGLGLPITRAIMSIHLGEISLKKLKNNTCFEISMPSRLLKA